jgi:predicted metal-binding membrane protein
MKKVFLGVAAIFLTVNTALALEPAPDTSLGVPTFSPWGMAITGLLLGAAGIYTFLKKK